MIDRRQSSNDCEMKLGEKVIESRKKVVAALCAPRT
jgi:hypothetical protein